VKSLVAENSQLASSLEAARRQSERCRPTRSSTVEEEVLALEEVSEGILCKKCLGLTEESSTSLNHSPTELVQMGASELISQAIHSVTTWTKEIGCGSHMEQTLQLLFSRLRNAHSPDWLDTWLTLVVISTLVLAVIRALLDCLPGTS